MTNGGVGHNGAPHSQRITFGQVAIRKGYASSRSVEEALTIQRALSEETGRHKPIGLIMLEMGVLGTTELIDVLKEMNGIPGAATTVIRISDRHAVRSRTSQS